MSESIQVAIVGAGPAGLFAAEKLATMGYRSILFNRDIVPGGMAEYGIYPDKFAIKNGLRREFNKILSLDQIHYYGNVCVGEERCLSIPQILEWGLPAVLVTCGAQGTKWLGIPGENLRGVYHAKDVIYNYNRLPPYSTMDIRIGKRVAIVGAGNVMADIAHYLVGQPQVEEIHICVRRGPAEVKFTKKELGYIVHAIDFSALKAEFKRVTPVMRAIGQNPEAEMEFFDSANVNDDSSLPTPRIFMHFLVSPIEIQGDENGYMRGLLLEDNTLVGEADHNSAKSLDTKWTLEADTVIFAIGDKVEEKLGLPLQKNSYAHAQEPRFPVEGQSYEVEDPSTGQPWAGLFIAGWSRVASSGLVGNAKKDGVNAAIAIDEYLRSNDSHGVSLDRLDNLVSGLGCPVVRKPDLLRLLENERIRAENSDPEKAKYLTNEEMLKVMGLKS
jgi:ferredoxin--NADP+ reductase